MYIAYTTKGNAEYASIAERKDDNSTIKYTYLGKVLDKERGIYKNRDRGIFTYDLVSNTFGSKPLDFETPKVVDKRKKILHSFDFGDVYLINEVLHKSGFWSVVDTIPWKNKDTLHAMVIFYITSMLPNCDAEIWYETSFACKLFPDARIDSANISDFLAKLGETDSMLPYHKAYTKYVFDHYCKDRNVLVDSMGIPNKCGVFFTRTSVHNNKTSVEGRIVVVAQRSTAIPLYFKLIPGSINDSMTLRRILEHCSALGIDVDSCLIDAGYSTDINLDSFYDNDHKGIIDYITRPKISATYVKRALLDVLPTLESKENFVSYENRYFYLKEVEVKVGANDDQPAYLYVGLDLNCMSDSLHKLLKRATRDNLAISKVFDALENQGVFVLLSSTQMKIEDVLPEYYVRQGIEQLNDISKNYTKLLPVRCHNEKTYAGHVFLSMIGTAIVRFMQIQLNENEVYLGSRFTALRGQKVIQYETKFVPDDPIKAANDLYTTFKVEVPVSLLIVGGKLHYNAPEMIKNYFKVPKKRIVKKCVLEPDPSKESRNEAQPEKKDDENKEPEKNTENNEQI